MFNFEDCQHFSRTFALRSLIPVLDPVAHILLAGEMRKEGIVLKDISDATLLNREVCASSRIEEYSAANFDVTLVGLNDSGNGS